MAEAFSSTKTSHPSEPVPSPSSSIVSLLASPSPSPSSGSSSSSLSSSSSSSHPVTFLSSHSPTSPSSSSSSSSSSFPSSSSNSPSSSSSVSSPSDTSLPSASSDPSSPSSSSSIVTSESGDLPEENEPFLVDYQNTMAVDHGDLDPKISIIISPENLPVPQDGPHGYLAPGSPSGSESGQGPLPEGHPFPPQGPYPPQEGPVAPQQPGDRGNVVPGPPVLYIGTATIHAEEIGLVLLVLLLWAGAITLFINRWGKLRMLEPYQPAYTAPPSPHRHSSTAQGPCINIQSTSELSLAENATGGAAGSTAGSSSSYPHPHPHHHHYHHHHSVSGPSDYLGPYGPTTGRGGSLAGGMLGVARSPSTLSVYHLNPQRKVKSAVDLVSLVMQEKMNTNIHLAATNV